MIKETINKLATGKCLTSVEAKEVMGEIMEGKATEAQISSFLTALRMKGESVAEIVGCAEAMYAHAIKITPKRSPIIDTCGTGGDRTGTFNISTIVAFILAGAGLAVAKHGNRAVSSSCGSADLLEALEVKIELGPEEIVHCIDDVGIGFLFAPRLHPAMKYAAKPRHEIGIRTIFNLLGPLTNPASASIQLLGVYDPDLTENVAQVLNLLGSSQALVVYGADGLDELSTTGVNKVTELNNGEIKTYCLDPRETGLPLAKLEELKGGFPQENAKITTALLEGEKGAKRDIVLLNAAAGLKISGKASCLKQGLNLAAEIIDSGEALKKLEQLQKLSGSFSHVGSNSESYSSKGG